MTAPPDFAIRAAAEAGRRSPCAKSKRGAAVFVPVLGTVVGVGRNAQPAPFACTADARCREACAKLCIHAEQNAIHDALARAGRSVGYPGQAPSTLDGYHLVHAKVVDGKLVAGGGPSCWQCSREILDVGIAGVWLYEARPPEDMLEEWCCYTDQHGHDCPLCNGEDCERCNPGPGRPRCEHDFDERHGNLPIITAVWRYYTADEFHRVTLAACGIEVSR